MPALQINVIKIKQNGNEFFIGSMRADDLRHYTVVDRWRKDLAADSPEQGYQRVAEPPRVKKFGNYLAKSKKPFSPTALLLSARDFDLNFNPTTSKIELHNDNKLQIVDGQHRVEGYRWAIDNKSAHNLIDFEVPIIIMQGLDIVTEMQQFRVINGTQKGVNLSLVNMILTQIAERIGESNMDERELSKIVITRIVEFLNNEKDAPWHNLIVMPNDSSFKKSEIRDKPELAHIKIVRATSFMTSLNPVYRYLNEHEFLRGNTEERARGLGEIVLEFWKAVHSLVPVAFQTPGKYVIQKTPGLFALHTICRRILPRLHMAGVGWLESEFRNLLAKSELLCDPNFWIADGGDAARYGSMKGFTELADEIDLELKA